MAGSNVGNNDTNISFMSWLFSPKGRIDRDGFRLRAAIFVVELGALIVVPLVISSDLISGIFVLILFVLEIPAVVMFVAGTIKRLHDVNRSGWWTLAALVPFVNFILWFVCGNLRGDGLVENSYGYRKKWKSWIPG